MEKLTALCCLSAFGLGREADYSAELDRLFLENSDDDFLLELENQSGDLAAALARLVPLIGKENADSFGRELFAALERFYNENVSGGTVSLAEFGRRCCELWRTLPANICHSEPFVIL